jgi:hypothetical protein
MLYTSKKPSPVLMYCSRIALARGYQHEPNSSSRPRGDSRVFLLSRGIQDVEEGDLLVNDALLAVGVLYRRVVLIHKVRLDELDRESRLSDT